MCDGGIVGNSLKLVVCVWWGGGGLTNLTEESHLLC
jgi:hypothetical protein